MYGKVVNGKIVYAPDNYTLSDGTLIIGFNTNEELMMRYGYKEIVEHEVDYDPNTEELYISNIKETINLIEVYYSSRNKNTFVNVYTRDETYDRVTIDGFINHLQIDKADISDLNAINAKITNLEAGRVDTEYLDANYATIEQLNATNANVSNLQADKANITDLHATNAEIENLKVDKADIAALTATNAKITNLEADKADISFLEANYATINQLDATNANITNLQADTANINNAIINKADIIDLNATNANIANLQAIKANITDLDAAKADINVLNSNVADIDTLINGNLTSDNIQSMIITGDKFTVADAFIKDAMIANVSASKINTGIINTNNVRIQSDDGSMIINGTTQQFKDKDNKVRIQIGKDAQGNFTFALFSQDGVGILIDETGIKSGAVPDGLIVNDMVSEGANISGSKLDINSVINSINNGTTTIKGTRIQLDEQGQSLEVAFNQLKTKVETIENISIEGDLSSVIEQVTSNTTSINTMQGQISSLISNTTITKANGEVVQLKDEYNSIKDTVNSHTQTIGSLETNLNKVSTGQNKWLLEMFEKGEGIDAMSPITIKDVIGKVLIKALLVADSDTNNQTSYGDNYLGRATTYVYLDHDYNWETTATSDDGSTIYLNGNIVATLTSCDPNVVTLPFKQGWNKITWVYNEGTGGDGWDFNPRLTTIPQVKYMNAYPMTNVDEVGNILDGNIKTVSSKQATLEQNLDGFKQTVSDTYATKTSLNTVDGKFADYSTTSAMNSAINQKANEITSTVSETYATKASLNTVDNKFTNYSTTSQMNSAINQKANEITSTVSETYATKSALTTVDNKFANYSTTNQMNSAIDQKANEINLSVSNTYATKTSVNDLNNNLINNYSTTQQMNSAIDIAKSGIKLDVSQNYASKHEVAHYFEGENKWKLDVYSLGSMSASATPTKELMIQNNCQYQGSYLVEHPNYHSAYGDNYVGYATTYMHFTEDYQWNGRVVTDDAGSVYLNDEFILSTISCNAMDITLNFRAGWNKLEVLYAEGEGGDGWQFDPETVVVPGGIMNKMNCYGQNSTEEYLKANYSTTQQMNSSIEQKANEITSSVSQTYSTKTETSNQINDLQGQINDTNNNISNNYASKSELSQTTNSITAKFSESGGYNLLRNTGFKNGLNYWEINQYNNPQNGVCEVWGFDNGWGFPDSDVNCCVIRISNQDSIEYGIAQNFTTTIGKTYTVSFYYASHRMSQANMIIRYPDGNWLTNKSFNPSEKSGGNSDVNNWGIFTHTFTATHDNHTINIVVNSAQDDGHLWIAKPMICEGELLCPYSPNPSEVYDGITQIDKDGIKVFHNTIDGENYTHMSPTGFYIKNRGEDIFKVDTAGLYLKGRMDITGGSVPSSLLSGQVSDNLIGEWIRNGATNGSNSATWLNNSAPGWNNATSIVEAGHTNWDNAKSTLDANAGKWNNTSARVNNSSSAWDNAYNRVVDWAYDSVGGTTTINGGLIQAGTITAKHVYLGDLTNYCNLIDQTASLYGFTAEPDNWGTWFRLNNNQRDTCISGNGIDGYSCYKCNGGESFRIKYQMKSNVKSGDTYCKVSIGCCGMLGDGNPFWTLCDGGMSDADSTERYINATIKIPDNARTFGVYLQLDNSSEWSGTCRIKNVQVIKMSSGELIVDGAITADKIAANAITANQLAADAITGKNITGGTINIGSGVFVVDANGQIKAKTIPNSKGQYLDMSSSTYKIYKNSDTLAMQIGFRDLAFEGGNVNYSTPCIFMGSDGINAKGSADWDAHSGRYCSRYYVTDNNGPTGDGHNGQPTMHFEFNTQYTDTDTGYAIPSKFKFYADGHMRISPVRDLEIYSYSNNGEVDSKGNEYLLAKFYSSNSNLYSSALDIPAVINTRRDDGILIADRSHAADGVSYDGNTNIMAALNIVAWHGENGNDYRYVRPYLDGNHGLGSADRRWGKIYSSYGTVDTSDRRCKTNINYLSPSNTKAPNKCIVSKEDIWNFIKDIDYASYNFIDSETGNTEVDNQFGFILQDLIQSNPDISNNLLLDSGCKNNSDAKDSPLMGYNKGNYINILGCALQQALVRIEELENKIKEGL